LALNTEYYAMSAEAKTGHGRSLKYIVLDEAGQIEGPSNAYVEMLRTSQGSYSNSLFVTISTQAPSDADYLSVLIDDAVMSQDEHTVCHVYESPKELDLSDPDGMQMANPGLGLFRSRSDLEGQLAQAKRLPSMQAGAENLLLNRRVALEGLWLAPAAWRENGNEVDFSLFTDGRKVALGLDLSARNDLTAAVLAARADDGTVHLHPFVFCPAVGIEERAKRDRAPYAAWVRDGKMIAIGGATMEYPQIARHLAAELGAMGVRVTNVEYDRWRIDIFKTAAEDARLCGDAEWDEVGQGYRDFSPRCEAFEKLIANGKIAHGHHPLLAMAASNAIATRDPAGNTKLDKSKSTQRIDPIVAAVMAAFAVDEGEEGTPDSYLDDGPLWVL
jgi:phage terminase large subunit-like protein